MSETGRKFNLRESRLSCMSRSSRSRVTRDQPHACGLNILQEDVRSALETGST